MKLLNTVALASLTIAAPAAAADLFGSAPPLSYPISKAATAVEVGTNWYIRGDVGVAFDESPTISLATISTPPTGYLGSTLTSGSNGTTAGFTAGLGFGYRFNDYLRMDATWDYWTNPSRSRSVAAICPYGLTGVNSAVTGAPAGYLYNPSDTCVGTLNFRQHNNTFLANGYVDLGTYGGFTPYIGGGLGMNMNSMQLSSSFVETANGLIYLPNLSSGGAFPSVWVNSLGQPISPQPGVTFAQQNWNRSANSTTYTFAFALAAGLGFQLNPSATLDVGYRYLNAGQSSLLVNPFTGLTVKQRNVAQEIRVGLRYVLQ